MPFPNLTKQFLSLVHYFGFGYSHNIPNTYIPNRVQAGDCLASYLRRDLRYPHPIPPHSYLDKFHTAIRFLDDLELLWEPPISATEQSTIFFFSFPHHMILRFATDPAHQVTPSDRSLNRIANGMQAILTEDINK